MTIKPVALAALLAAFFLLASCGTPTPVEEPPENPLLIDVPSLIGDIMRFSPHQAEVLQNAIDEEPLVYFRMINTQWAAAVCEAFTDQFSRMPAVRLQGDAHIEQYALTFEESQRFEVGFDQSNGMLTLNMKNVQRRRGRRPKKI